MCLQLCRNPSSRSISAPMHSVVTLSPVFILQPARVDARLTCLIAMMIRRRLCRMFVTEEGLRHGKTVSKLMPRAFENVGAEARYPLSRGLLDQLYNFQHFDANRKKCTADNDWYGSGIIGLPIWSLLHAADCKI